MAEAGLRAEALDEYRSLLDRAGNDASRRCGILRSIGRLQEEGKDLEGALASFSEALTLLAHGNWLRRDLEGRVLGIHRARGSLSNLADDLRESPQIRLEAMHRVGIMG